jgi:PAS domain S-box-containing protein
VHDPHSECKPENAPHQSILLVDDSPEELAVLEASLAPLGQRLVRAHSGQEALKKILVEDFACILLDARMPGLDGRETALFIQSLERTRHVPLLFLMEDEEAGAADCVVKPVEPELLRARVRGLLDSRRKTETVRDERPLEMEWELLLTERKHVEARLEASRRQFRTLAEALPETVWMAEPARGLIYVNGAMSRVTGLAVDELLGMGFLSVIHPDHRARSREIWSCSMKEETPFQLEHLVRGRDGRYRWHLVRGVPVKDDAGRVVKWVGLSADVHESRQAQQELQRRADFEQHLVGMVSHDLRNPLNAILLTTRSLLRRGGLDDGQTRGVERIQGSVERAIRMIRDLLDFTQARLGGGILLERRRVDMHEVVRGVLDEVEVAHPGREVRWGREGCGLGEWDADRIAQVMQNLVTNALKYSPEGTPVRVESRGVEGALVLSVHNGGQPIAPGQMERLFQPFQRATAEVDKAGRSVGLGLYIVKHLVDAHGGALDVRSTSEEGTTFSVRVPRKGG